jgi:hypothetical protein
MGDSASATNHTIGNCKQRGLDVIGHRDAKVKAAFGAALQICAAAAYLEIGDTAGLETCATVREASPKVLLKWF